MAIKQCEYDGVAFEAKRKDAIYCSDKCRKASARGETFTATELKQQSSKVELPEEEPYDAEAALKAFHKMGLVKVDWLSTGIPEFDEFQKIPRGRLTQIQGPFACGKTTLCLNMIRGLKGVKVLYIDTEASLNPDLMIQMKLDPKYLTVWNETAYVEDMYEQVVKAADSGKYDLIIVDSLAACTTKVEEEGDVTSHNIGQKAKMVNKLMRVVPMKLKNTDTALVIINQERDFIGGYVPTKYTPGGRGPEYHASLMLRIKTIKSWRFPKDPKNGLYLGHEVEVEVIKSKVSTPWRKTKFKLTYPNPIAQEAPVSELGKF